MRFSCAPPERGGQTSKGNKHVLSILKEHAAQHGPRPVADRRQRQLQTLVRRCAVARIPDLIARARRSPESARFRFIALSPALPVSASLIK